MATSSIGEHHLHTRKRIYKNLEEYPHPNRIKSIMDKVVYFAAFLGMALTIPQLYLIWIEHQAAGVSVISWAAYAFISAMWISYGILHKEKPLIIINSGWFILNMLVVIGAAIY